MTVQEPAAQPMGTRSVSKRIKQKWVLTHQVIDGKETADLGEVPGHGTECAKQVARSRVSVIWGVGSSQCHPRGRAESLPEVLPEVTRTR